MFEVFLSRWMKLKFTLSSGARQDRLKRLLFSNSTAVRRAANKESTRKVQEDVAKGAEKEVKNLGDPSSPSSSSSNVSVNKGSQKSYPQSFDLLRLDTAGILCNITLQITEGPLWYLVT